MTSEEKKLRRKLRHQVYKSAKRLAVQRCGLFSTGPQLRHMARVLTDRGKAVAMELKPVIESEMKSYLAAKE